jgi:pSer/pThr/pTyr-binding forkhead associated (FHA) protein
LRRSQPPGGEQSPSAAPAAAPRTSSAPARTSNAPGRDPELVEPGAIRTLSGFLVSYDQNDFGIFWPLYQGQNVIGRKGAAPGLDIEIDHPTTSSRHAVLYASARPGRLKVEDTGSTNGSFLADTTLERGKKYELKDGDTLRFGGFIVTVKII